ncbi:hypothetical protein AB0950_35125 [Streptomyces sp. NPDC007189]|uniref:hypothetical protein n=1 Tax=Streptomyces sp. NPDC007189 TaxID=3154315 RepID=UPI003453A1D8
MRDSQGSSDFVERLEPSDPIRLVVEKCKEVGYAFEFAALGSDVRLTVRMPNGRQGRLRRLSRERARSFLTNSFTEVTYLGDFDACLFKDTRTIEASIQIHGSGPRLERSFLDIPGIRKLNDGQLPLDEELKELRSSDDSGDRVRPGDDWVLDIEQNTGSSYKIELGTVGERFWDFTTRYNRPSMQNFTVYLSRPNRDKFVTLRLINVDVTQHDDALQLLTKVSDALFFEIDLRFDVPLKLAPARDRIRCQRRRFVDRGDASSAEVRAPRTAYSEKPLSLYWYGRSSAGIPLLEFLAYYQVLEYYFPSYSRRDILDKLRHELRDPRFEVEDDAHLSRVLMLAAQAGKGYGGERDQLKATVKGCVTEEHVKEFLEFDADFLGHLEGKALRGVARIDVKDRRNDLLNQVANRVYDIRCRIVHTKEDGGESAAEILLPFSKEAESLGPDVELVKFLAQKCLIAGASKLLG